MTELTPELLLLGYESGYFPMAEHRDSEEIYWFNPDPRAIIPLDAFHLPRRLKKMVRHHPYRILANHAFTDVIRACAEPRHLQGESWINPAIQQLYIQLHELGHAHSIECYEEEKLVGGLYGVSRGGAFFGESMFSRASNTSKICFVYLLEILLKAGYQLLDSQFTNEHMQQFGIKEIPRKDYLSRLESALIAPSNPSRQFANIAAAVVLSPPGDLSVITPEVSSRTSL